MKRFLLCLLPILTLCGCASDWYLDPTHFIVRDLSYNKVEIIYQRTPDAPRYRIDMRQRGIVTLTEGRSVAIGDAFDVNTNDPNFTDVRTAKTTMTPELFCISLQSLVDAGLMEREDPDAYEEAMLASDNETDPKKKLPKVLIYANLNGSVIQKFTSNKDLITEVELQLYRYRRAFTTR